MIGKRIGPYEIVEEIGKLQNMMYAERKHALLVVIQGMDASGKDGLIRDVFKSINPMGVSVSAFKKPTELEFAHDFLWRIHAQVPEKGMIKIFNRSHYEDILIQRVHEWIDEKTVKSRMKQINNFEEMLEENGTTILKFYLHISQEEQHERLKERMENPEKMWKYNAQDWEESKLWSKYMKAYEKAIKETAEEYAPWFIIPADNKWFMQTAVCDIILNSLEQLNLNFPELEPEAKQQLEDAKQILLNTSLS